MGYDGTLKFDTSIDSSGFQNGINKISSCASGALKATAAIIGGAATAVVGIGTAGVDVSTSSGVEHFSLTEKDQLNLFGKKMQLLAGEEKMEYHEDGQPCKYFTATDMQKIVDTAMFYVSYNTTYCNALNMWIKSIRKASELEQITWGAKVPEEFQSEVLKDYMKTIASGGIA